MEKMKRILSCIIVLFFFQMAYSQGLPPGWEYTATADSHTISVSVPPLINGVAIQPGDYIGIFYINDEGGESCGGAFPYTGGSSVVTAFGDDPLSNDKDGFSYMEPFIFKIYSWCSETEYGNLTAILSGNSFNGLEFVSNGLTILQILYGTGPQTYVVAGNITSNGAPLPNVIVDFTNGVNAVTTDGDGSYQRCVPDGWSGDITPSLDGYSFDPVSITLTNIVSDSLVNNFITTQSDVIISGVVTASGIPLEAVSINFNNGGGVALTNASGYYEMIIPNGWSGIATPQKSGYSFTPINRDYSSLSGDMSGENYSAVLATYTVSGTITEDGAALPGVTVSFSNNGGDAITNASGNYAIVLPSGWSGTATPFLLGKDFSPQSIGYPSLTADVTEQNYVASMQMITLSGRVLAGSGSPIANVEMVISGMPSGYSNAQGFYSVEVEYGWTGTIQPIKAGYDFTPGIRNIINVSTSQSNLDFTGIIQTVTISGTINDSEGDPMENVSVVFSNGGGTVLTDAVGFYSKTLDYNYSGLATPALLGYIFTPSHHTYSNITTNQNGQNFTGTIYNVTISGYITERNFGNPIEDVIVFFDNGGGSDTTNYEGYYTMSLPSGWSGTVYPDLDDYTFFPDTRTYDVVTSDLLSEDYEGSTSVIPSGWNVVPTGTSHIISIPVYSIPSINGTQISIGDYIGVFFWDAVSQTEKCGGYIEWTGQNAITAYGDDPSTAEKDGFSENELFRWRIHSESANKDFEAIATYYELSSYTFDGKYHNNGLSQLLNLNADDLVVEVGPEQTELCHGSNVIISASPQGGSGIYSFAWTSIPAGYTSSQVQIIVSPSSSTTYFCEVSTYLSVESNHAVIDVLPLPVAPGSVISSADEVCVNDEGTIELSAIGGSGDELVWFADGMQIGSGSVLSIDSPEVTTSYCAQWESVCGVSECISTTVIVNPLPVAPQSVSVSDNEVCINDEGSIVLSALGGQGDLLSWYVEEEQIGSGTLLTIDSPEVSTTYCARWENNCGISDCVAVTVDVIPLPVAPESVYASENEVCINNQGSITLYAQGGSGETVAWYVDGLLIGTGNPLLVDSPEVETTYCAQYENECAVSSCVGTTVSILPLPSVPQMAVSSASEVCVNDEGTITLSATGGSGDNLMWYVDNQNIGMDSPLIIDSPEQATTYCARWENSCGVSDCTTVVVEVIPLPIAPVSVSASPAEVCVSDQGSVTLTAEGGSGDIVNWYTDGCQTTYLGSGVELSIPSPQDTTTYYASWESICGASLCAEVTVTVVDTCQAMHVVSIPAGWSGISSYVVPDDNSTENLFAPVIDDLIILKNLTGAYWPPYANTIPVWDRYQGYKVKVDQPCEVLFVGEEPEDQSVALPQGWSILSVLSSVPVSAEEVFAPLGNNVIIVKSIASSGIYWPGAGVYTMQNVLPGKAYMIAINNPDVVDFSVATTKSGAVIPTELPDTPWKDVLPTPNSHTVALQPSAMKDMETGDVIGAFSANGLCVGVTIVDSPSSALALSVYGDDPTTAGIDGMLEGENIYFKLYSLSDDEVMDLKASFATSVPDKGNYATNGLSIINALEMETGIVETGILPVHIYPIPAKDRITLDPGMDRSYSYTILDLAGNIVLNSIDCIHISTINVSTLSAGVYMIRVESQDGIYNQRVIIGR